MGNTKNTCPNCGDPVLKVRWDAGFRYCKKRECFDELGRKEGVTLFDKPPHPDEVDTDPYDLDDVAELYGEGD